MHTMDTNVTDREREFREIWQLLTDTHRAGSDDAPPAANTWTANRFESWMLYSAPVWFDRAGLNRRLHLWKTEDGQLVGFVIVEGAGRDVHAITHPLHRETEPRLFTWVKQHWPAEGSTWVTYAETGDDHRERVLTGLGYAPAGEAEILYAYDLERGPCEAPTPAGYALRDARQHTDRVARARLRWKVFHPGVDAAAVPEPVMHRHWSYDPELDLVVTTPGSEPVAFATGWINPQTHIGEVEPVGTHPDYLRLGLARAAVTACFARMRERGARWAHIASEAEPAVSNRLYRSLGPVGEQHFVRWVS
jgi:GNAT superfamily N-acetyltransferase